MFSRDGAPLQKGVRLPERSVLITGASSGIGEATASILAARGARLVLVARRSNELERVQAGLRKSGHNQTIEIVPADITRASDRNRIRKAVERLGELHLLINNAGITAHGRYDESVPGVLRKTFELNFFAATELTGELLPIMKRSSADKMIVYVSTPSGLYGIPGRFAYSASKAAGHAWMESMRFELEQDRIGALIFCPGYTRTALRTSGLNEKGQIISEEQARGAASPEHIAGLLCRAIERDRRLALTNFNGRVIYLLRTLAPGLLFRLLSKKLKKDFQRA